MPTQFKTTRLVLVAMTLTMALAVAQSQCPAFSQSAPQFDVASVKPSQQLMGPDYNNQFSFLPAGAARRDVPVLVIDAAIPIPTAN